MTNEDEIIGMYEEPHKGMICGCEDCVKLKGGMTDVFKGGQPSVDSVHDILVELGLEASVDGIDKQMYLKAKAQLLAHALSCLPEKYKLHPKGHKYRAKLTASLVADNIWTEGFNAALDLMEQSLRKGYE